MKKMTDYTIYCTEEQTRKALELGAPIFEAPYVGYFPVIKTEDNIYYEVPTAEEMLGWLEEQGIWVQFCKPYLRPNLLSYSVSTINSVHIGGEYPSRQEATLAAIDAALEYLVTKQRYGQ